MTEQKYREQITEIAHIVWQNGWVAANDGNLSVKIDTNHYLTTPTGISKRLITPEMLVLVDGEGKILKAEGNYRPSSEFPMHLRCYREREDVNAVLHAHPPTATGFAIAGIPMDSYTMPEAILTLGAVPIASYGTPSTQEIPDAVAPWLAEHDAILLENHGALTVGKDLLTAYYRMETLELFSKSTLTAKLLGGERELPMDKIEACIALRKKFNLPGRQCGYKKFSK